MLKLLKISATQNDFTPPPVQGGECLYHIIRNITETSISGIVNVDKIGSEYGIYIFKKLLFDNFNENTDIESLVNGEYPFIKHIIDIAETLYFIYDYPVHFINDDFVILAYVKTDKLINFNLYSFSHESKLISFNGYIGHHETLTKIDENLSFNGNISFPQGTKINEYINSQLYITRFKDSELYIKDENVSLDCLHSLIPKGYDIEKIPVICGENFLDIGFYIHILPTAIPSGYKAGVFMFPNRPFNTLHEKYGDETNSNGERNIIIIGVKVNEEGYPHPGTAFHSHQHLYPKLKNKYIYSDMPIDNGYSVMPTKQYLNPGLNYFNDRQKILPHCEYIIKPFLEKIDSGLIFAKSEKIFVTSFSGLSLNDCLLKREEILNEENEKVPDDWIGLRVNFIHPCYETHSVLCNISIERALNYTTSKWEEIETDFFTAYVGSSNLITFTKKYFHEYEEKVVNSYWSSSMEAKYKYRAKITVKQSGNLFENNYVKNRYTNTIR